MKNNSNGPKCPNCGCETGLPSDQAEKDDVLLQDVPDELKLLLSFLGKKAGGSKSLSLAVCHKCGIPLKYDASKKWVVLPPGEFHELPPPVMEMILKELKEVLDAMDGPPDSPAVYSVVHGSDAVLKGSPVLLNDDNESTWKGFLKLHGGVGNTPCVKALAELCDRVAASGQNEKFN
jgi:hypothetical protein